MKDTVTLADALPQECARVREMIGIYRTVGPAGAFAIAMMEADLRIADKAMVSGDVVAMLGALKSLQEYEL